MLKLSLITFRKMLFLLIISSLFLPDLVYLLNKLPTGKTNMTCSKYYIFKPSIYTSLGR